MTKRRKNAGEPVNWVRKVLDEEWYPFRVVASVVPHGKKRAKRVEFVRYGPDGDSATELLSRELERQGFTVQAIEAHTMPAFIPHGPEGKPVRTATVPPLKRSRRNPHLLTIGNPSPDMAAAIRAYKRFHGIAPPPGSIKYGDGNGVLIALGELSRIDYRPRKGDRRGPIWFHHFKPGCVLCTDPAGRRLVVLDRHGKRLVDFDRGIVR